MRTSLILFLLALTLRAAPLPPGTVIHHSPASSKRYIGSPALCVLPNGDYLASHDYFGPASNEHVRATGRLYRSTDQGKTWRHERDFDGFFWTNLFVHRNQAYALGTDKHHGQLVIRRSEDHGKTWTGPAVLDPGQWHTAPMPVVEHRGRLWRAVEDAHTAKKWGERYRARTISIPVDADLLDPAAWTFSNALARDPGWLDGDFGAWLEGNAVVAPDGGITNILRVEISHLPELAAIVRVSEDGGTATFDPAKDFVDFPGGAKKFTIRKDPDGPGYWSLANLVRDESWTANLAREKPERPAGLRNTLALLHSDDLRHWETRCIVLHHPDPGHHGFQYVDWLFDGDDLIAAVRTAFDDDEGGAHRAHDANFLTFHRWKNFRALNRADDMKPPGGGSSITPRE
ncbi:sialidase family protein [Luteolibacter marinus]|uniref:sialidase family protein n=1 Tax=Luteolibacter marinus TaxID=2776705 RepID=UPI001868B42B|nr:sialidase family protein [Luteolibacter marinus]